MFKKKTVFIVGAGGSKEVNLPVGDELKAKIALKVDLRFENGYDLTTGDRMIMQSLISMVEKRGQRDVNPYCTAGRVVASAMPQSISIDNFLHTHAEDERMVTIGKLGIAAAILDAESDSAIKVDPRNHDIINFGAHPNIWHNTFCKMLCENVQKSQLEDIFENVSFITFNYDRCIEHYISQWLANYMQIGLQEAQELTNKLTVIHPYGQVGKLPWQKGAQLSVPFAEKPHASTLLLVANQIRTFTERMEADALQKRMFDLLSEAERVVFLGFSYGEMNLELLTYERTSVRKHIYGTSLGMSEPNKEVVARQLESVWRGNDGTMVNGVHFEDTISAHFLNNWWRPIIH
jgi:hypothetical protein